MRRRANDRNERNSHVEELSGTPLTSIDRLIVSHLQCKEKSDDEIVALLGEVKKAADLFNQGSEAPEDTPEDTGNVRSARIRPSQ